jgi:hypothetical protein
MGRPSLRVPDHRRVRVGAGERGDGHLPILVRVSGSVGARPGQPGRCLGTPIEPGSFVSGNLSVSGASGEAELVIPISGPKGKGTLVARATKRAGEWRFSMLLFEPEHGRRIDLLEEPADAPQQF